MTHNLIGIVGIFIDNIYNTFVFTNKTEKKNVVVVGYGWGGKSFCDNIDRSKYNVTIVSKNNYMLNTPKLKNSIVNYCDKNLVITKKNDLDFIIESNIELDKEKNLIITKEKNIKFDYLVVEVGSEVNDFNVKGVKENCFFLKTLDDLENLRKGIKNNNKEIVILGGGPTGLEIAFEISKTFQNIKIIEGMDTILPNFSNETKNLVKKNLEQSGIQLILSNQVKSIEKNIIKTNQKDYSYDLAIWTCGIKPNSFVKKITTDKFIVNNNLKYNDKIYALGDIVASKELGPPTAQNAKQQGKYLANYFNNNFVGEPYKFIEKAKIIHTNKSLIIESNYGVYELPYFLEPIIEFFY